ncbi:hypothetical protein GUITHDRAFT_102220 [Guillardia theta CCMP2712]|uniref:Uncharacterized protein n=3 Tax=Guillardia theta TaxID=55529 RepID=L1JVW7_GUITC|nr:hypothetical protein GUITHDRAFT_102220 [Guillardia theta CCMP2712]EKX52320.1 hypothetical protein GUITHDRAFT_102220 [Guillardia theta CCMP2712]|eukprot:XP_005839300.1 hypothetical protein GUITHDRAFT_102220 [Guillardia theta CCMP2712]
MEQNYAALVKGRDKQQLQRMLEMKGIKSQSSSLQVFDVVEETRAAGQALTESMREKLDQSSLKANLDSMAGKVVGHVSSTMVKTFT